MENTKCPCGSNRTFSACCQPIIDGHQQAETAETLMRSRYTAFTLARVDYLMKSHHPTLQPVKEKAAIRQWAQSVQWMGLVITETNGGQPTDQIGYVTFKALYMEQHHLCRIYERSLFERLNGEWVYVSGVQLE